MSEEQSLEATSLNRHRGCGRDMLGQTVPSTGNSQQGRPDRWGWTARQDTQWQT